MPHETIVDKEDALITAGMLADRLRPLVLASCDKGESGTSCLDGTPMIPLHRATVGAIYAHLERIADWDGERTIQSLEIELRNVANRSEKQQAEISEKLAKRKREAAHD